MDIVKELRKPTEWEFKGNEAEFEAHIIEHLPDIMEALGLPPIAFFQQQKMLLFESGQVKPDLMIRHTDDTITIIEIKKSTQTAQQVNAIGQLLLYSTIFNANAGARPRLILLDNRIYDRTFFTVADHSLPITLVEFQKDRIFVPYGGWNT